MVTQQIPLTIKTTVPCVDGGDDDDDDDVDDDNKDNSFSDNANEQSIEILFKHSMIEI